MAILLVAPLHVRCRTAVVRFGSGPRQMNTLEFLFAGVLLLILIISFRSRAVVFCQFLEAMTGITLKPSDVRRVYKQRGKNGVREMFLELLIREDLKDGPIEIPEKERARLQ